MSKLWASFYAGTRSTRLPIWMSETSGYVDTIEAGPNAKGEILPGALDLAQSIYAALYHGHASAWVWWQGSELGASAPSEFALMSGVAKRGKKYYVSKNYYRTIRTGAQMVQAASDDSEVLVAAFDHSAANTLTIIAINGGQASKSVTLTGANLPSQFQAYRTSATEDYAAVGPMAPAAITLPARSITSLVSGDVLTDTASPDGGDASRGSVESAGKAKRFNCGCRLTDPAQHTGASFGLVLSVVVLVVRRRIRTTGGVNHVNRWPRRPAPLAGSPPRDGCPTGRRRRIRPGRAGTARRKE
jgi:hypothetical protein